MELEIITEKEASPFGHVFPELLKDSSGRRYCRDQEKLQQVMGELLQSLGLGREIKTLEVGAGSNLVPSAALHFLGAKPATLDADWQFHLNGIKFEDLRVLSEAQLYPRFAGKNIGITHYLGDVAFIGDERSELRGEKYDFLFYWGSIHSSGYSSTIDQSRNAAELHIEIPIKDRLAAPISNVKDGGSMAYVSGFFSGIGDPSLGPNNIPLINMEMAATLLDWANYNKRKPAKVIVFGLNRDFTFEYLRDNDELKIWRHFTEEEIRKLAEVDSVGKLMEHKDYCKDAEVLSPAQQKAIRSLGLVDCIAVQYRD